MSDPVPVNSPSGQVFVDEILPVLFPASRDASTNPIFVLLAGQPGAGAGRAVGRLMAEHGTDTSLLRADDLRTFYLQLTGADRGRSPRDSTREAAETAEWLRASMAFAREHRRSLILEGSFSTPSTVTALATRFATDGFQTRVVVVAARRAESLLSNASLSLRAVLAGRPPRFVSRAAHDQGFEGTRALTRALEESDAVDRITVLGRNGDAVFDKHRQDQPNPFSGATSALTAGQAERLTSLQSAQWLSELRHVTTFAMTLREIPRTVTEQLIELHEMALREVIPELAVPANSQAAATLERRSASDLVALRRLLAYESAVDATAPVLVPGGPERGGPTR